MAAIIRNILSRRLAYNTGLSLCMAIVFLLTNQAALLMAHGDDGHTHAEDTPTTAVAQEQGNISSEAVSDKYELLIRYKPVDPGEEAHLTLFISEYATNKPITDAKLTISAQENAAITFTATPNGEGSYLIETIFPDKKNYSLAVSINSALGADLMLLSGIEVGKVVMPPDEHEAHNIFTEWQTWLIAGLALLLGLLIGMLFQRRNTQRGKQLVSYLLLFTYCLLPTTTLNGHGDDDHGAAKSGNVFSNSFRIPKETQFLFDVLTEKVASGAFTESSKLFGTIIPGSKGQALVSSPQSGKIVSLKVQVGEPVKPGQVLATIEQNIDAGTQVNQQAEKNNLLAELEAAKKELARLQVIQDIVAKKDIDEAKNRLQKAQTNLELFSGNFGKTIVLHAPISGVVANFTLSTGATVNAGEPLFTITNLQSVLVEAQVFDKDAQKVQEKGASFTIECSNDTHKTSNVKLVSLAQEVNATNQSQRVLFELNNPDSDFKIGEFVNIRVFAPETNKQIALPNSAITELNGKPVVFVKEAAEKYAIHYVQIGVNNGTYTSIIKGIEETERVVVNGTYQLKMIYLNQ